MTQDALTVAMILADEREVSRSYSVPEPSFGTAPSALLEGLARFPHCEIHLLCCLQESVRSPSRLADNIHFHALTVPKMGWLRSGYIGCISAVRACLGAIKPDVVHGQGTERHYALCAAFSGFPNVVTIHGNMRRLARLSRARPLSFAWCTARLESFVLPRTQGFICPSAHTQRQVEPRARRTWVIPNAVDSLFFDIQPSPPSIPTLLCLANILPLKNQIGLIEALDELAARSRFRLLFAGSGPSADDYVDRFRRLVGQRPWCEYFGGADRKQIKQLLASATALVLPSFEENCPMAVLEAMAAGVPVLASHVGGTPEVIRNEETGLLFDPADPRSITNAVDRALGAPDLAAAMARAGRVDAQRRFHPTEVAAAHLTVYNQLRLRSAAGF